MKTCENADDVVTVCHSAGIISLPDDLLTGKHRECQEDSSHRNAGSKHQTRRLLVSECAHAHWGRHLKLTIDWEHDDISKIYHEVEC